MEDEKTPRKPCKYFVNGTTCPFDDVGCMFVHDDQDREENDNCHLCDQEFNNQEDLIVHLRSSHLDTFINMAENEDFYVE